MKRILILLALTFALPAMAEDTWKPGTANPIMRNGYKPKPGEWVYQAANGKWRTVYKNDEVGCIIQIKNDKGEWVDAEIKKEDKP